MKRDVFIETIKIKETEILKQADAEEFLSVYFRDDKIGYVINRYAIEPDNDQLLDQEAKMHFTIGATEQTISLKLKATLSPENYLKNFQFSFNTPFYQMQANGTVTGKTVKYELKTGTNTISDTVTFPAPPLLATSRRAYLLNTDMKIGEKRRIPWFDPISLTSKDSVIEYHGQESVLINGRMQKLHRFSESFSGTRVSSWLNDTGTVVKEESPAGFVFIKEPKFKALAVSGKKNELLSAVSIKIPGKMADISGPVLQYRLELPADALFDLNGGRQKFVDNLLTLTREDLPASSLTPSCQDAAESLLASPYIQSNRKEISDQAKNIVGDATDAEQKVKLLAGWVYENIEKKPVIGLPDAITTLETKQGDCNEHATLFAALARASAIPTRIAAGVTYHKEAFYYHAWNEVCLGDRWISIDSSNNQFPADLTHLRFVIGEMQEQIRLVGLLGKLRIEPLSAQGK